MKVAPEISVVVPARNAGAYLDASLRALRASDFEHFELLVVDDASTDGGAASDAAAQAAGARLLTLSAQSGPAAARNLGATEAVAPVILFVDADVVVRGDTLASVAAFMRARPEVAAVFGSYDDAPPAPGLVSQYKNLLHHFTHQRAREDASTFWAGCGAVRREAFARVGGFDARRYARPSIEDVELGQRLRRAGYRVALDKSLQVAHLKCWTLRTLLRADVCDRAVPWSRLILDSGELPNDLNLSAPERACAALSVTAFAALLVAFVAPLVSEWLGASVSFAALATSFALVAAVCVLKRDLYAFFFRRRGVRFLAGACALHLLYYLYSSATFAACRVARLLPPRPSRARLHNQADAS